MITINEGEGRTTNDSDQEEPRDMNESQPSQCATYECEQPAEDISVPERSLLGEPGPLRCAVCRNAIHSAAQALAVQVRSWMP